VSKPFLEAPRDETDLGQMEMSFRVASVDSENSLQQALGAIHALRTPFVFRLQQQLVALHGVELPGFPQPKPLCALFLFGFAPSLIGHLSRGAVSTDILHGHSAPSGATCRHCGGPSHVGGGPAMSSRS
jgi:hypothetical protein